MRENDFDAIIVGGGPAGSTAGAYLARAGMRVLIVEKERFPRFHIGESVMPVSNAILRDIGVWDKVEQRGVRARSTARSSMSPTRASCPNTSSLPRASCRGWITLTRSSVRTSIEILLQHASELGCDRARGNQSYRHARPLGRDGYEITSPARRRPRRQPCRDPALRVDHRRHRPRHDLSPSLSARPPPIPRSPSEWRSTRTSTRSNAPPARRAATSSSSATPMVGRGLSR